MKRSPLVSVVIVNWNGLKLLTDCLKTLAKISYPNIELIVVDNGSTDGSVAFVKKQYPKAKIVQCKTNLGFAKANNLGVDKATGEYILFLNNDTKVPKNFLEPLVEALDTNPAWGLVQPKIVLPNGQKIDSVGSYLTDSGFLYHFGYYKSPEDKLFKKQRPIYSAKGACMLARHDLLKKIGVFDESFFAYFEETDLCHKVWLSGYQVWYVPGSLIYHLGGETSNRLPSAFVQYHSFKNRLWVLTKNLELNNLLMIVPINIILCLAAVMMYLVKGHWRLSIAILKSLWWYITNIEMIINQRKLVQNKLRKVSEKQYWQMIYQELDVKYLYLLFSGLDRMPIRYYYKYQPKV